MAIYRGKEMIKQFDVIEWFLLIMLVLMIMVGFSAYKKDVAFVKEQTAKCEAMGGFAVTDARKTTFKNCAFKREG